MYKLQLLTSTNKSFTFRENWFLLNSGATVGLQHPLIQVDCETQISSKTKGRGCLVSKTSGAQFLLVESLFAYLMLEIVLFLQAILFSFGVCFNHSAAVYNPP